MVLSLYLKLQSLSLLQKKKQVVRFFTDVYKDKLEQQGDLVEVNRYKTEDSIDIDERALLWWKM